MTNGPVFCRPNAMSHDTKPAKNNSSITITSNRRGHKLWGRVGGGKGGWLDEVMGRGVGARYYWREDYHYTPQNHRFPLNSISWADFYFCIIAVNITILYISCVILLKKIWTLSLNDPKCYKRKIKIHPKHYDHIL